MTKDRTPLPHYHTCYECFTDHLCMTRNCDFRPNDVTPQGEKWFCNRCKEELARKQSK